jgi:hypothetical protein
MYASKKFDIFLTFAFMSSGIIIHQANTTWSDGFFDIKRMIVWDYRLQSNKASVSATEYINLAIQYNLKYISQVKHITYTNINI